MTIGDAFVMGIAVFGLFVIGVVLLELFANALLNLFGR